MSWTYSGDPTTTTRDELRYLIQDTDTDHQQFSNEELAYLLTEHSDDPNVAAVHACETLIAKYARLADKSVGDLSISYSQIGKQYESLLKQVRRRAAAASMTPWLGGRDITDKDSNEADSSLVQPAFKRGLMDWQESLDDDQNED